MKTARTRSLVLLGTSTVMRELAATLTRAGVDVKFVTTAQAAYDALQDAKEVGDVTRRLSLQILDVFFQRRALVVGGGDVVAPKHRIGGVSSQRCKTRAEDVGKVAALRH